MPRLPQPREFVGTLRPYQRLGLSWLAFLDRCGLGGCLADDMGLGKTIQLIALLLHEREEGRGGATVGPTLLIVPTSLVINWTRELSRFAPTLTYHVHHGPHRPSGDQFVRSVESRDIVITTYALIPRDSETPGSLEASLAALAGDHDFLLKGDVFTPDVIETWIDYKTENEVQAVALRPHPHEFELYYDL